MRELDTVQVQESVVRSFICREVESLGTICDSDTHENVSFCPLQKMTSWMVPLRLSGRYSKSFTNWTRLGLEPCLSLGSVAGKEQLLTGIPKISHTKF